MTHLDYNYHICYIHELPNIQAEVLFYPGATFTELAATAYALQPGVSSLATIQDSICFSSLADHGFTTIESCRDLVLWRQPNFPKAKVHYGFNQPFN